jgi:hypothetical protein
MQKRELTDLDDLRLLYRGNKIMSDLFSKSYHSIRQITKNDSSAKGFYRFLQNDRVSEDDIVYNLSENCKAACRGKFVICIQDTTEINLSSHSNRIKKDDYIGTTNATNKKGLGFMLHPSLVLDANDSTPYGYADIKVWNRPLEFTSKHDRNYSSLPIEEKESYKWIEVSKNTKSALNGVAADRCFGKKDIQYKDQLVERTKLLWYQYHRVASRFVYRKFHWRERLTDDKIRGGQVKAY